MRWETSIPVGYWRFVVTSYSRERLSPFFLERETGVEPATSSLGSWHSTTELLPLDQHLKYNKGRGLRARSKWVSLRTRDSTAGCTAIHSTRRSAKNPCSLV